MAVFQFLYAVRDPGYVLQRINLGSNEAILNGCDVNE